jgi:dTDP-4-dehydrorhamnose reductase
MKILLLGATGLLGRCFQRTFASHQIVAVGHRHTESGPSFVSLENQNEIRSLLQLGSFSHIVNCAAIRDPEACLANPGSAYQVNAVGVEYLAALANQIGACLCHISTDYVFDGRQAPYRENDIPCPVNVYGRSKLAGEYAAKSAKRHLILRIPALYRCDLSDPRNVASVSARWLRTGQTHPQDHATVRYYTLADEVAQAAEFLLQQSVEGIIHLSAKQRTSKADFIRKLAAAIGCRTEQAPDALPATGDARPLDSHLCTEYYESLQGPAFSTIDEALTRLES